MKHPIVLLSACVVVVAVIFTQATPLPERQSHLAPPSESALQTRTLGPIDELATGLDRIVKISDQPAEDALSGSSGLTFSSSSTISAPSQMQPLYTNTNMKRWRRLPRQLSTTSMNVDATPAVTSQTGKRLADRDDPTKYIKRLRWSPELVAKVQRELERASESIASLQKEAKNARARVSRTRWSRDMAMVERAKKVSSWTQQEVNDAKAKAKRLVTDLHKHQGGY